MQRGYIKVWRKLEDSGLMDNAEVCRLFLHLLLKAASKRRKWLVGSASVDLLPGQLIVGRKKLAADVRSTERKVRTCLAALENMGIITQRATNKFTVVSFVNWHRYQTERPEDGRRDDREASGLRPGDAPSPATKQEEKKKEEDHVSAHGPDQDEPARASSAHGGDAGQNSPMPSRDAFSLSSPDPEFFELRAHYDRCARSEAPLAGFAEYRQCRAAQIWPGARVIHEAIDGLARDDADWLRGYAPGLARFLREHQWRKKPAAPRPSQAARASGQSGGLDPTLAHNMEAVARVLARQA